MRHLGYGKILPGEHGRLSYFVLPKQSFATNYVKGLSLPT